MRLEYPFQVKGPVRCGPDMKILISGGGIAGLCLAALLQQRGFKPVVVEQADQYKNMGYVLGLWPAGSKILKGLGLYEEFLKMGEEFGGYEICTEQGKVLNHYDMREVEEHFGAFVSIYRPDLISLLLKKVDPASIRNGWMITSVRQGDSQVEVTFNNGSAESFDLLVVADGIRSHTRQLVFGEKPLTYSGMTGWGVWVDSSLVPSDTIQEYWGKEGFCGVYPAKARTCAFLAIHRAAGTQDPKESRIQRIQEHFKNFGGIVPKILENIKDPSQVFHDDFFDIKVDSWVKGRVVMIGDAAHAVLPTGGVGATLAMESAAVLAEELCRSDSKYLPQALSAYERRRRKRVDSIQAQSRSYGKLMFTQNSLLIGVRNFLISKMGPKSLYKYWEKLFVECL